MDGRSARLLDWLRRRWPHVVIVLSLAWLSYMPVRPFAPTCEWPAYKVRKFDTELSQIYRDKLIWALSNDPIPWFEIRRRIYVPAVIWTWAGETTPFKEEFDNFTNLFFDYQWPNFTGKVGNSVYLTYRDLPSDDPLRRQYGRTIDGILELYDLSNALWRTSFDDSTKHASAFNAHCEFTRLAAKPLDLIREEDFAVLEKLKAKYKDLQKGRP